MLGFLIGTVCLIGLFKVARRHHYGYAHFGGPWGYGGGYGGGCGRARGWHHGGPGAYGRRDWDWDDEDGGYSLWEARRGGGGFFGLRAIFARLDTTPGQEKAIKAAFAELREKARAVKDDARGMRGDIANALRGESLDAETLGTVASRASGAVDALRDAAIGALLKVHDVLDERQRAIAADFIESGPRFGGGWRGRGGPYRAAGSERV
jgi:hypothetical protein